MIKQKVFIPFRDRGLDPRRGANLELVQAWWHVHGFDPRIVDDGLEGDAPFNRHRAYNKAVSGNPDVDVFVFSEADMLIPPRQINEAVHIAGASPGLVVPFTQYRYLSDDMTGHLRDAYLDDTGSLIDLWEREASDPDSIFGLPVESQIDNGESIGAINVVSRETLDMTGGFTEATSGNWYDDNIIEEGFKALTGRGTRWVPGPAVHLYHLPGWKGDHLSEEDRAATRRNRGLLIGMRADIRMNALHRVKALMETRA